MPEERELTREQALELVASEFWKDMTQREIAEFQLFTDRLCMPWDVFRRAMDETLGRATFCHEYALNRSGLQKELMGEKEAPTFEEIMNMIPEEKRIIVLA